MKTTQSQFFARGDTRFSHTAHYNYIDAALKSSWRSFVALEAEMSRFVPKPSEAYDQLRRTEADRLRLLNPSIGEDALADLVESQVGYLSQPQWQFFDAFDSRHMAQYVSSVMLSHALCEAIINAILAIGLAHTKAVEVFQLLER